MRNVNLNGETRDGPGLLVLEVQMTRQSVTLKDQMKRWKAESKIMCQLYMNNSKMAVLAIGTKNWKEEAKQPFLTI